MYFHSGGIQLKKYKQVVNKMNKLITMKIIRMISRHTHNTNYTGVFKSIHLIQKVVYNTSKGLFIKDVRIKSRKTDSLPSSMSFALPQTICPWGTL